MRYSVIHFKMRFKINHNKSIFIPDFILGIGLFDDVFVIGLILKQIHNDLQKYEKWKSFTHQQMKNGEFVKREFVDKKYKRE